MPVMLYGCETWPVRKAEEQRIQVTEEDAEVDDGRTDGSAGG